MDLTINIAKDEERFIRDEFGLFLAKKGLMKKLIEIQMAESLSSESQLTGDDADMLADLVKDSMYQRAISQ